MSGTVMDEGFDAVGAAAGKDADALRVRQIFRFLAAAESSRTRPVRTLDGAQGIVWFDELPEDPRVASILQARVPAVEPCWLTVARPDRQEAPEPPPLLAPWLDAARIRDFASGHTPPLRRRVTPRLPDHSSGIPLEKSYPELDQHPERERIEALYATWAEAWRGWAERRRAIEPLVSLYDRLHKMHEDATGLGEAYELVLGFGRLVWQTASGERVERHLLTHRATIRLDPSSGTLTAAPDAGAIGFQLEENMLDADRHVQGVVREKIREALDGASDATEPEHLEHLHTALRSWVNAVHSAGGYQPEVARTRPSAPDVPSVGFTPALVLRERTRRSTLEALSLIAEQVERGAEPTELLRYIAGGDGALTAADLVGEQDGAAARELYFALPANEEQRTIAERLDANRLVVVQGPPGTGKTHTIANLVTDLLAQGNRILITSQTPRALRVLRDKLPAGIRDLAVSRTEDGTSAQRELEASIDTIVRRFSGYDPRAAKREIDALEARLAAARSTQEAALGELAALRDQETHRFPADIGDYAGSLQEIARRLTEEAPRYAWIGSVPQDRPALDAVDALRFLHVLRAWTPEQQSLAADVPEQAQLPSPGDFEEALVAVRAAEKAQEDCLRDPVAARYQAAVQRLPQAQRERLAAALDSFAAARVAAQARAAVAGEWAGAALQQVLTGQDMQVRAHREALGRLLPVADAALAFLGGALVTGIEHYPPTAALDHAMVLHAGLRSGQKLRGALGSRTKLAKAVGPFVERVRVDGLTPDDAQRAEKLAAHVRLELDLARVENQWGRVAAPWSGHGLRVSVLRQDAEVLDCLLAAGAARQDVLTACSLSPQLAAASWHDPSTETAVRALLGAQTALGEAERSRRVIADAGDLLRTWTDRPGTAPALAAAREAVIARDPEAYRKACEGLAEVRQAVRLRDAFVSARQQVRAAFPDLARQLLADPDNPEWDVRLPTLGEAWAWSAWCGRIERLTDPEAERNLRARLAVADDDVRINLRKLAEARAWDRCLGLLTGDQATALKTYQQAVRRIKGKYQNRYRREAQNALREAQGAVPAWIMPLHMVAETVPMERPGIFDVVIVDEASQSGLDAMLLSWLGRRIVVVGDSKQVSPSNVGLRQDEFFQLQDRLLSGLTPTRRSLFGPDRSLFDLTEALAGGRGSLMLKEHFRCMPEIIAFSNELCYNGDLLPLRQYGTDRLPPVRTVHVPDGEAVGSASRLVNRAEAEALVDAVARCCADPAYEGLSMGVISLRASAAHRAELENLLVARLPYEERDKRRIRVGDAEDFQGDERHVMFVSCVNSATTAAGTVPGGYVGKTYEQRINVAASRAQDQVWVFHSARPEQFHENDLRRAYLDVLTRAPEEEKAAVVGQVLPDHRHEAFEDLFQQQVYLELVARGYRVRPQYRVGRHAIDLVVEGGTRRLAVECDGDSLADGDSAAEAAARQRDLERVGWSFVRIRGSRFSLDREQALAPLWQELDRLGIAPPEEQRSGAEAAADAAPAEAWAPKTEPESPDSAATGPADDREQDAAQALRRRPETVPGHFPVRVVNGRCQERILAELYRLHGLLSSGTRAGGGDRDEYERGVRIGRRIDFLRAFLDAVSVDREAGDPDRVVPGALLALEVDGEELGVRTVAEVPSEEAGHIPPASALAQALMWQPVDAEVAYIGEDGSGHRTVIRRITS